MHPSYRSATPFHRRLRYLLSILIALGFMWFLPGSIDRPRSFQTAAAASDPVIAAAGDIACDPTDAPFNGGLGNSNACRQKYTSDLLVNANLAAVLGLGDTQYFCGGYQAFLQSYDLSWGRIKAITHPSVGNHEYLTSGGTGCDSTNAGAAGYFNYFGSAAGAPGSGYYSFDVGTWHIIALNSNCTDAGGCAPGTPQYTWLQNDLAAHSNFCTLAYWHIPLFSSGGRAAANSQSFWQLLYNNNADLILNGHDHIYERFAPQDPTGAVDGPRGMPEFIVGTGGANHTSLVQIAANSQLRNTDTFGVLKLTLHATGYDWQFVPEAGKTFTDSGTGACHGSLPDVTPPYAPANLVASSVSWNQVGLSWAATRDNVAVTGYKVFRNGTQVASTSKTTYTDTSAQAQTNYSYYVTAFDAAGNNSAPSNTVGVSTPAAPTILTFSPSDDTYVESDLPTTNFGASTQFVVDNSPVRNMLLKFNVSGVGTQPILYAKLRLYCLDPSPFGGEFHRVADTSWHEGTVNWNTAPPADPAILGSLESVAAGSWVEVDVSSLVTGDGRFSIKALSSSSDGAYYSTKEGAAGFAPQLVVALPATAPTPTYTPTVTSTPTFTPTNTPTNTPTPSSSPTFTPTYTSSPTSTPTSTSQASLLFSEGFETGNLSQWTTVNGLVVQTQEVASGSYAARGTTSGGGATYARKQLAAPQTDVYYSIRFKIISQGANTVNLMKFRTVTDGSILSMSVNNIGKLAYRNDITGTSVNSTVAVSPGSWQTLQVYVHIADTASQVTVWYNNSPVSALTRTESLGTNPIGRLQLGENTGGLTYDIAFDDVAASLAYIGSAPAPAAPLAATATFTPTATPLPASTSTPTSSVTATPTPTDIPAPTPTTAATATPS